MEDFYVDFTHSSSQISTDQCITYLASKCINIKLKDIPVSTLLTPLRLSNFPYAYLKFFSSENFKQFWSTLNGQCKLTSLLNLYVAVNILYINFIMQDNLKFLSKIRKLVFKK